MHVRRNLDPILLFSLIFLALSLNVTARGDLTRDAASAPSPIGELYPRLDGELSPGAKRKTNHVLWSELFLFLALLGIFAFLVNLRITKSLKEEKKAIKTSIVGGSSPKTNSPVKEVKQQQQQQEEEEEGRRSGLVFFVEEDERFKLENLLDAGADMQNQNYCSSLYKVQLNNNGVYAVKRLKKLQASNENFDRQMAKVGKLNHPNIIPLVAYSCQGDEKLLIYKYQNKGSLLSLMESKLPYNLTFVTTKSAFSRTPNISKCLNRLLASGV